ncbi:uncharacterized protein LOC127703952 [Mytilus californianus]|uniref:uncharacterized protein LOC127703952 n=1 Tax=Mytilus californianus TaxID=6549 RepID=UPI002246B576|nr:uncharacterized protein LOC127703952 [Mytilus californianus]
METSTVCTEHLKLCKFYCPRHTDILCSQCTVKYLHRSCHLSDIDELLSNSYYGPLVKHAHESVTESLEIIQQKVHDLKQNHNTESVNSVTNQDAGKVNSEANDNTHNTGSDNSETRSFMVECSKQYDSVTISIITRMNELKGSDMTKEQFCFVVSTYRFLFTLGNILQNVKKYFHTNECCISFLKSCQQLITTFHLHIRMREKTCLVNISSYSIVQPLSNNSGRLVIELNRKIILPKGERKFMITSCWFMPDSKMVFLVTFVHTLDKSLIIHDEYGSPIQSIPIYGRLWDVTPVGIDKMIVRYIDWNWFEVLDFSQPNRVESRRLRQISFKNDLKFSSSDNSFVEVYRPSGEIITSFPVGKDRLFTEICSDKSNIYYIDKKRNIMNCFRKDDTFKRMCKFDNNECITSVMAIGSGCVLLTGKHNLAVLNFDQRIRHNVKVDGAENFNDMWTSFNRKNNTLLVCSNSDDFALLFNVKSAEN